MHNYTWNQMIVDWKLSKLERIHIERAATGRRLVKARASGSGQRFLKDGRIKQGQLED